MIGGTIVPQVGLSVSVKKQQGDSEMLTVKGRNGCAWSWTRLALNQRNLMQMRIVDGEEH